MRRLLAAAAVAAACAAPATAHASHHGQCGGVLDIECTGYVCPMDCFSRYCTVWVDPLHSPFTALCLNV